MPSTIMIAIPFILNQVQPHLTKPYKNIYEAYLNPPKKQKQTNNIYFS